MCKTLPQSAMLEHPHMPRSDRQAGGATSELHPVTEMTVTNDQATINAPCRTEFLDLNVVYAIRRTEAMAVGIRSHRQRLLRRKPRQDM